MLSKTPARGTNVAGSSAHAAVLRYAQQSMGAEYTLITGTANPELASLVARHLGVAPSPGAIERFSDGEVSVELGDTVRCRGAACR
ncbi:MAG: ribose-phosphate pyrophosphokinase-like domain-containing protein [Gemmatimonadaceae bacterium]